MDIRIVVGTFVLIAVIVNEPQKAGLIEATRGAHLLHCAMRYREPLLTLDQPLS